MASMVMLFAVDPALSLDGITIGSKVVIVLAVDFSHNAYRVERIDKLDPATVLDFGAPN